MNEEELMEISERMGEAVHNAWMEKRRKEKGWHSPEECPNKNNPLNLDNGRSCGLCHPGMRPYRDLPDSEKELDMLYPKLFFKILDEMRYEVKRKIGFHKKGTLGFHDVDEFYPENEKESEK